jgi:4-amino-4-deoxy-L-arabinose transferase-like glycosyltransferase
MRPIVFILLVATILRLAAVLWLSDTVPYSDYAYYETAAQKITENWGFFFDADKVFQYGKFGWWPPLYPFSIAAVYSVLGVNHRIVVFLQVLLGTLVCWLVYRIGRRAHNERTGLIAAGFTAVNPTYIFATNLTGSENLYVVWLSLGLLLALRPWRSARQHALAGFVFALGALTRAIGLLVPVIVGLWTRHRAPTNRAWLVGMAWLLGVCGLTILPWTIRNAVVVGSPAIVCFGGGLNFYFAHNDTFIGFRDVDDTPLAGIPDQVTLDKEGYRLGWECIARHPFGVLTRAVEKTRAFLGSAGWAPHANSAIRLPDGWRTDPIIQRQAQEMRARQRAKNRYLDGLFTHLGTMHFWIILIGGVLASTLRWKRLPDSMRLLVYLSAYWFLSHAVFFWAKPRFRYPMEIFLMLLTAFAIDTWLQNRQKKLRS